ncbi:inner membrane protein YbjM [Escherichia coli]|uniref:Inner membrane protein YbjM n=1 Tax=Escherichia coli TaxID=562 RepID=A0A2X1PWA4_ECOLX|nr:inner membrane protein YbjM [Escherichia coli]
MKHKQRWAGAICCFVLFIVVCLFLATHMKGAFRAAGHPEIGLLFFILPGAVASFFSQRREVLKPLFGAMLAAPCSMLIMRLFFSPTRSFWQELAWLLSAVFLVCAGALCFLFISSLFKPQHRKNQ